MTISGHSFVAVVCAITVVLSGCVAGAAPEGPRSERRAYTIEQATSDRAQLHTIAFSAFAFETGSLGADSFFPPGKVADWWGFQYLRDNDPSERGHNTDFLSKAALNMLHVLTPDQRARLVMLAHSQVGLIEQYALDRFPLMDAFRRLRVGELPDGATGLDMDAVKAYSAQLYRLDGRMSLERAQVMGGLLHELDAEQRAYLDGLVGTGMLEWPQVEEALDRRSLPHDVHVAVMTYAGDMFSWYAGSLEADVYFCPERHGTYFGGFYLKDAPAMGNRDYTISSTLTGNAGEQFLEKLTPEQARLITDIIEAQRPALEGIVETRREVAEELRRFMAGEDADAERVMDLCEQYGELDGELVWRYATAFAAVGQSLSDAQRAEFAQMRTEVLGDFTPEGAFAYSRPIAMPQIPDTDFLFGGSRQ